jgi:coproporphyrinogen III oxidase-like Fe-S oxidoreductase
MSGIYIHIPFCKQACHYCDFHFSTTLKKKGELVNALCRELVLRKGELIGEVQTIYFGGGTPSLLSPKELEQLIKTIYSNYSISETPEITLEANPDDLSSARVSPEALPTSPKWPWLRRLEAKGGLSIESIKEVGINRLSIGVQSFFEEDLKLMNRAHTVREAIECIEIAKEHFDNISIDLIYGIPGLSDDRWLENLHKAIVTDIPHISCYALTVEPKTALKAFIEKGLVPAIEDEVAKGQHELLLKETEKAGYDNYEFSNFGKPGYYSQNNLAYWQGKTYLGIGPSAHSFNGEQRSWNIANNSKYINSIGVGILPLEREHLSIKDKYNEYIMTRLRTQWGVSLDEVRDLFGKEYQDYLLEQASPHIDTGNMTIVTSGDSTKENYIEKLIVTKKGKFLADGIASDLFLEN